MSDRRTLKGFISYAERDTKLVTSFVELMKERLAILSKCSIDAWWARQHLLIGHEWSDEIDVAMQDADFGLFLVSPAFLGSEFIGDVELAHFLERSDALLFPVGLKTVNLQTSNMKGLAEKQLFRYRKDGEPGGRWFNTTNGANQDRFCDQLVDEMLQRFRQEGLLDV